MRRGRLFVWALALPLVSQGMAVAGMASPLPSQDAIARVWRLNDTAALRLQAISFFALGLLLCAATVRGLWNSLQPTSPGRRACRSARPWRACCSGACCSSSFWR